MRVFIEVTNGDWGWLKKKGPDSTEKHGLKAPAYTKYLIIFRKISPNDIVLTYLARTCTENPNWKSSIVGISRVKGTYYQMSNFLKIDTYDDRELPRPIVFQKFSKIERPSELFRYLLRVRLQKYLVELEIRDFVKIMQIHDENFLLLQSGKYFEEIDEMREFS